MINHEYELSTLSHDFPFKQDLLPSSPWPTDQTHIPNSIPEQKLAQWKKDSVSSTMKYLVFSVFLQFFQDVAASQGSLVLVSGYNSALNIFNITGDKSAI